MITQATDMSRDPSAGSEETRIPSLESTVVGEDSANGEDEDSTAPGTAPKGRYGVCSFGAIQPLGNTD